MSRIRQYTLVLLFLALLAPSLSFSQPDDIHSTPATFSAAAQTHAVQIGRAEHHRPSAARHKELWAVVSPPPRGPELTTSPLVPNHAQVSCPFRNLRVAAARAPPRLTSVEL